MGRKNHVLIPKLFRDIYGMKEVEEIAIESREEGPSFKVETIKRRDYTNYSGAVTVILAFKAN
jgi:bifunctional DNA-binding transcriptional regulator/antitoxin component of YhaV-PrlF toxin-antitoxin module